MSASVAPKPVVLCILDGWGERADPTDNAIAAARTPTWDRLVASCPKSRLMASAGEVGLPEGQMGNSEVGHMNLGAGRIVMQDLPKIDAAVADGSLASNPELVAFMDRLKTSGGTCHLMGLLSPGGVHSSQPHIVALVSAIAARGIKVAVHAFLDGRDTPPSSARGFMESFEADIAGIEGAFVATVSGRFYAMDRDNRWERVSKAYDAMTLADGEAAETALAAIDQSYAAETTDEFVLPTVIGDFAGMHEGDGLMMANFRADRAREILAALVDPDFDGFARRKTVSFAAQTGMVEYSAHLAKFLSVLFPADAPQNILGEVVSGAGLKQLRIAETEKYAHVTFFLNGGQEDVFAGEDRILVPSPKVATYDLQPEMSAPEVTSKLVEAITSKAYDLIVVNYANGDMVGHTGIFEAAIKAAQTIDESLAALETAILEAGGTMLITADHGNAESMKDASSGQPHTAHTLNPVPLVLVNAPAQVTGLYEGRLADVAPTVLELMGLDQPAEMTGKSLLTHEAKRASA